MAESCRQHQSFVASGPYRIPSRIAGGGATTITVTNNQSSTRKDETSDASKPPVSAPRSPSPTKTRSKTELKRGPSIYQFRGRQASPGISPQQRRPHKIGGNGVGGCQGGGKRDGGGIVLTNRAKFPSMVLRSGDSFVRRSNSRVITQNYQDRSFRPDPPSFSSLAKPDHHNQTTQNNNCNDDVIIYQDDEISMVTFYYPKEDKEDDDVDEQSHKTYCDYDDEEIDIEEPSSMGTITERTEEHSSSLLEPAAKPKIIGKPTLARLPSSSQQVADIKYEKGMMTLTIRGYLKKLMRRHKAIKMLQILLAFYIGVFTIASIGGNPSSSGGGYLIDQISKERTKQGLILVNGTERPVVAITLFQLLSLGVCRLTAFFMYPALIMVFISKFRATTSYLARTPVALLTQGMIDDLHQLHVYCGWTIFICSTIHSIFHLLRWILQGNIYLLYHHVTGFTGAIITTTMLLICLPMTFFKEKMKFEIRKYAHYLFVVFAFCLIFHTSPKSIPNGGFSAYVFSILIIWWLLDMLWCTFVLTEKIESSQFEILRNNSGVQLTMKVSEEFQKRSKNEGGLYCYVLFPFINNGNNEWHAFSLFENPTNPTNECQIFLQCNGDWTTQVYKTLQERNTNRPIWVQGPFPSPYNHASSAYDGQILVASGIGVTPALSVIRAHNDTNRRINLIWTVRNKALLEFFLRHLSYLDNSGWNLIFYTGSEPLNENQVEIFSNTNICIIYGRPNLRSIIPNIIHGIESKIGLPENYLMSSNLRNVGSYKPWESSPLPPKGQQCMMITDYVKKLDRMKVLSTWGILYCGGSSTIKKELKDISNEYNIDLHVESFKW